SLQVPDFAASLDYGACNGPNDPRRDRKDPCEDDDPNAPRAQYEGQVVGNKIGEWYQDHGRGAGHQVRVNQQIPGSTSGRRPDLWDLTTGEVWEIKKVGAQGRRAWRD